MKNSWLNVTCNSLNVREFSEAEFRDDMQVTFSSLTAEKEGTTFFDGLFVLKY